MKTLAVRGLAVTRGDRDIFRSLDFCVGAGEILQVQGRNGAGKTSLLETLVGLRTASAGVIQDQPTPDERHWMGHRNALNATLTPLENLRFWCALNAADPLSAIPALERMGLKRALGRPCGALSTGQRRRASFARLLVMQRPWWFLDEPLAGIDVGGLSLIAELIGEHARSGGAVILSSHQSLSDHLPQLRTLQLGA